MEEQAEGVPADAPEVPEPMEGRVRALCTRVSNYVRGWCMRVRARCQSVRERAGTIVDRHRYAPLTSFLSPRERKPTNDDAAPPLPAGEGRVRGVGWVEGLSGNNAHKRQAVVGASLLALLLLVGAAYLWWPTTQDPAWLTYSGSYRLVPESISQSAAVVIALPDETLGATPEQVTFTPELRGDFVTAGEEQVLVFQPKELPELGAHYNVALAYGGKTVAADFKVAEDPRVVSILPVADTETHEDTEVSVIFNRPMVPLSTRGEMDKATIPVRLDPDVPGVWKWKSTRLLQFIPEEDLTRSTHYTVTVNEGFQSLDGVAVAGFTHSFTTRTLKQDRVAPEVRFDEPLVIPFNQPVDLARTAEEVVLTKDGEPLEAIIEYAAKSPNGRRGMFGLVLFGAEDEVDTTRLWIRPIKDSHGRTGLWDFASSYTVSIAKKYPTEGGINDEKPFTWSYTMPTVLQHLAAESPRSNHVTPEFYDPEGELVATFYEPVDLTASKVSIQGLREVRYGTECIVDSEGRTVKDPETKECKRQDNKKEVRIRIDQESVHSGESLQLSFERVVNDGGLLLNVEPLVRTITVIPQLSVYRTLPAEGATQADLRRMTICTNTPLKQPESVRTVLRTQGYVVYPNGPWMPSYRITGRSESCGVDEFQTSVEYGLHPEAAYRFDLSLEDEFGARVERALSFTTQATPAKYTRFHSLQKYYNVTVPERTRLTFAVENLPEIVARICKVTPETMLTVLERDNLGNAFPDASLCTSVRMATIDLPDTYWVNNYFYFNLKEYVDDVRGHYIITFTHQNFRDDRGTQLYDHTLLSVSNLTVGEKSVEWNTHRYSNDQEGGSERAPKPSGQNLYWVLGARTLDPILGATVASYDCNRPSGKSMQVQLVTNATTDGEGVARVPATARSCGATVSLGGDTALVSERTDTLAWQSGQAGEARTYLYSDRPIYRPGDTVSVRGIDRVGYDQKWQVTEGYEATLTVRDSRGDTTYTQKLPVSRYGTFDTTLTLPADAPLGTYHIDAAGGSGYFEVEEYVGAPFKVTVSPNTEEYVAGDTATFRVEARYYFDMAVGDAEMEYTVLAQDYYFDRYQDEYFNFGAGWYSCYWCGYGDTFVTRGTVVLDREGKATVEVPLDFAKYFDDADKEGSKLFTVIARVKDKAGKQVVGQNTAIVHRGEYYLGGKTDPYFAGVGQEVLLRAKSVDTKGVPIVLRSITLRAEKLEWESYRRREVDGGYYWHSEETRTQVASHTLHTDKDGNASWTHAFTEPGEYAIVVERTDSKGNRVFGEARMYVWGEGDVSVRETNNESLEITSDKPSYAKGEEATILVESPFARGRALIAVERGDVYEYWTKPITTGLVTQSIPIRAHYAPNVFASVLLVGDGPEVKFGTRELSIGTDEYRLAIEVVPSKTAYVPGEEVVLAVRTKNAEGNPVSAEVSVAVVDLSVLALVGNPKKDPVGFFYGGLPLGVSTAHSAKNMLIEADIPTGTKGGGGGEDLERRKRGTFRDTAHWQASVVTDEQGEATVRFVLPDNLTTWQIETLGVTTDTLLGVDYTEFVSKKRLMAIPVRPRFVVPGDTMWLGMQVANNTDDTVVVRTHIESPTLEVLAAEEKAVRVEAGAQKVVYFATKAPLGRTEGTHVATFFAVSDAGEDVVEQSVPILEDKTFEVTATAGMTTEPFIFESVYVPSYALLGQGSLTVSARPTLVASLLDAVREMSGYPYGCSEQIASRLASLATIRRTRELFGDEAVAQVQKIVFGDEAYSVDEAVEQGLRELLSRQEHSGGFSFYAGTDPSVHLTVEVIAALSVVRESGYTVSDDVFARAGKYVSDGLAAYQYYDRDADFIARVAYALSSPYVPERFRTALTSRVTDLIKDPLTFERLSTTALGYLALATLKAPYERKVSNTFFDALQNRVHVDARGAYVQSSAKAGYSWFESPEKNTALFVRAVAERGGEHATLDNLLRWLLRSKRATGGWGSTNATFTVLDAVLRLSEVRKENQSSYLLTLRADGEQVATHTVTRDTLFDPFSHVFPLDSFARERLYQIGLEKSDDAGEGTVYYDMELRYALPPEMVPPRDEGITVERALYARDGEEPITEAQVGDLVTGKLTITIPEVYHAVSIESFVPAGFEIVNFNFATEESRDLEFSDEGERVGGEEEYVDWWWDEPVSGPHAFPVSYQELHDDRVFVFADEVRPGTYMYEYTLRALVPGEYRHMPASVSEMYTPEVFGRSEGGSFTIREK